jgi:hypothetical protein
MLMKKFTFISLILALSFIGYGQSYKSGLIDMIPDSVVLGPSYADDIYYSFEDGVVATVPRTNWDIGFHTTVWSATIITNGAAGVDLYTYPNSDTAGWSTVDTAGMLSWTVLYDSEESWEDGAFTRNATGHPDYGWGKYNPITHDVVGDSVYILKTLNGTFKKLWIVRKNSINNTYYIRHANLDGSNDVVEELNINPYRNMNFIYYAFSSESIITREPDTARWDIVFTKYMAIQPNGTPYPVVGVMNNLEVFANEFHPVAPDFIDYPSMPFDSTKSPVGWEWKTFDMGSFTWTVADSTAFFVHTRKNNVYKLVFTKFVGSSTGVIVFNKEPMSASSVQDINHIMEVSVYPNPVKDQLTIDFGREIKEPVSIAIFDISGKQVYSSQIKSDENLLTVRIPGSAIRSGLHFIRVITGDGIYSSKFMIYKN